jgi:hypothetical protein
MGFAASSVPFIKNSFHEFYGVYYGQAALNIRPDTISWLVNETTENAVVTSIEKPGETLPVYDLSQLYGVDPYSLFMEGPAAVVTARNPNNSSGRGLILFRDSFASALSPLLLEAYSSVTMIDLRYIRPDLVGNFIDFTNQDVLFIYSASLFNNSAPLLS